jgi:uncharacterized membrane protein YeiH
MSLYDSSLYWIGMAGMAVFAITGVLAVLPKGVDIFGATAIGTLTAVSGGTLRDLVLDVPVYWSIDSLYIWITIAASILAFWAKALFSRSEILRLILYLDGLGVALFAIQGTSKAWHLEFGLPVTPVVLGIVTAVGGGLIRDVLAGRPNLLMTSHELYLTPIALGCILYALALSTLPQLGALWALLGPLSIFGMRSAAIYWNVSVPSCLVAKPTQPPK